MQNILLAAEALGLGTCPVMSFHRASVRTVLDAPSTWTPLVIVALGHVDHTDRRSNRKPRQFAEFLHWETFEGSRHA